MRVIDTYKLKILNNQQKLEWYVEIIHYEFMIACQLYPNYKYFVGCEYEFKTLNIHLNLTRTYIMMNGYQYLKAFWTQVICNYLLNVSLHRWKTLHFRQNLNHIIVISYFKLLENSVLAIVHIIIFECI